ncbi:MAG: M23 family metallopeptidase [Oscillospiraceae bacterium]|nr:M23 family metallopeptidase [Oscillospiraceae bacterium]
MNQIKNFWRKLSGKGYYIALTACAVAIAIAGIFYARSSGNEDARLQNPDVPAIATLPTDSTDPTANTRPKEPLKTGLPLTGETVLGYAMDCLSYNPTTRDWRVHDGIDIAAEAGTAVKAAADGVVYTAYADDLMGTTVVIRHADGYVTTYASLDPVLAVSIGDTVKLGQTIGAVGDSALLENAIGDHVHFCVTLNDMPLDPARFFALG